jgi:hypothetical protein
VPPLPPLLLQSHQAVLLLLLLLPQALAAPLMSWGSC